MPTSALSVQNFFESTLSSSISASDTTIPLNTVPTVSEGYLIIEPDNASNREIIYYTSKTGSAVLAPDVANGRGQDGTSAISHSSGATVRMVINAQYWKDLKELFTTTPQGWTNVGYAPNTVTYNGNRSYDLVFNSVDLTSTISPGMRLRTTRTVAAPNQCASLNGTNQYFNKTSPSGLSFTTTFTCSAWVKLSSYALGGIIARRNADTEGFSLGVEADGTVRLIGLRIASNNKRITSYQSLPLNKWVHVAATLDMAAGDTTAQKIWIDGVEVPRAYTLTGTATALVQGTTALTVGALKSAGDNPFPGKIAQAAVFSAQLSDATVKAMANQTLTGSETSLVSAFSLSSSLNDLNTGNANNLTAQNSAVATNTDSPFGTQADGSISTTLDYAIVQKTAFSTNTTLTVQVPEGCTIPTTGGVTSVAYSSNKAPYGMPVQGDKWQILFLNSVSATSTSSIANIQNLPGHQITIPVGNWVLSYVAMGSGYRAGAGQCGVIVGLSTLTNTIEFSSQIYSYLDSVISNISIAAKSINVSVNSATVYYLNIAASGTGMTGIQFRNDLGQLVIAAKNAYL